MRVRLFLLCIFFLGYLSSKGICSEDIRCDAEKILGVVKSLESSGSPTETRALFDQLAKCPKEAVFYLVRELHVVPEQVIRPGEQAEHTDTMHVIWCIRALRYLTNGMDFTGKTAKFDEYNKILGGLPIGKDQEVYFFSVWMSRDILYVAPKDAQAEIIEKWKKWYANDMKTFKFKSSKHLNDWYF